MQYVISILFVVFFVLLIFVFARMRRWILRRKIARMLGLPNGMVIIPGAKIGSIDHRDQIVVRKSDLMRIYNPKRKKKSHRNNMFNAGNKSFRMPPPHIHDFVACVKHIVFCLCLGIAKEGH